VLKLMHALVRVLHQPVGLVQFMYTYTYGASTLHVRMYTIPLIGILCNTSTDSAAVHSEVGMHTL
jgi:hypothetical protein